MDDINDDGCQMNNEDALLTRTVPHSRTDPAERTEDPPPPGGQGAQPWGARRGQSTAFCLQGSWKRVVDHKGGAR